MRELDGDVGRALGGVAVVVDPLVAAHRHNRRRVLPAGQQHPFALHQQHIAQVAAVLERGPGVGLTPRRRVRRSGDELGELRRTVGDLRPGPLGGRQVVDEAAVGASVVHPERP